MAMDEMTRENDEVKIALEQQRLKRRQLELDEMARFKLARCVSVFVFVASHHSSSRLIFSCDCCLQV